MLTGRSSNSPISRNVRFSSNRKDNNTRSSDVACSRAMDSCSGDTSCSHNFVGDNLLVAGDICARPANARPSLSFFRSRAIASLTVHRINHGPILSMSEDILMVCRNRTNTVFRTSSASCEHPVILYATRARRSLNRSTNSERAARSPCRWSRTNCSSVRTCKVVINGLSLLSDLGTRGMA